MSVQNHILAHIVCAYSRYVCVWISEYVLEYTLGYCSICLDILICIVVYLCAFGYSIIYLDIPVYICIFQYMLRYCSTCVDTVVYNLFV